MYNYHRNILICRSCTWWWWWCCCVENLWRALATRFSCQPRWNSQINEIFKFLAPKCWEIKMWRRVLSMSFYILLQSLVLRSVKALAPLSGNAYQLNRTGVNKEPVIMPLKTGMPWTVTWRTLALYVSLGIIFLNLLIYSLLLYFFNICNFYLLLTI